MPVRVGQRQHLYFRLLVAFASMPVKLVLTLRYSFAESRSLVVQPRYRFASSLPLGPSSPQPVPCPAFHHRVDEAGLLRALQLGLPTS